MSGILPFGAMFIELFFIFTVSGIMEFTASAICLDKMHEYGEAEMVNLTAIWNELFLCALQAIWENQFYYLFGFLFLVFIILVISVSQISIVMVYFQLCGEVSKPKI